MKYPKNDLFRLHFAQTICFGPGVKVNIFSLEIFSTHAIKSRSGLSWHTVFGEAVFFLQIYALFSIKFPGLEMRVKLTNIRCACCAQAIRSRSGLSGLATSRQHTTAVPVGWFHLHEPTFLNFLSCPG